MEVQRLAQEQGWKTAQNVAAGVAGLVVPILWFGMDWQGTASKEAQTGAAESGGASSSVHAIFVLSGLRALEIASTEGGIYSS